MLTANSNSPLITLTLFGYESVQAKLWAFGQMGLARNNLSKTAGLRFWKMLGSGNGGGFSLQPNWARYGLFAAWETPENADLFFSQSQYIKKFQRHASEIWTVRMLPIKAHGKWGGANPFLPVIEKTESKLVAVLTRASINLNKLNRFWKHVPATSKELVGADGLIASIGIGEAPFIHQATFSLWQSEQAMQNFAYKSPFHREVIKKTRQENWYKEELFARFTPIASEGSWNGFDPLAKLI